MVFSVIGTGAIGGFYGGMLAGAGQDVHFLLNTDYDWVNEHGLQINSAHLGGLHLPKVQAYQKATDMPPSDVILVGLKSNQNEKLLPDLLPPLLKKDSLVILIQNGLGVEKDVADLFPGVSIAGGIARVSASKVSPGVIRHFDNGRLELGSYNLPDLNRLEEVVSTFQTTGLPIVTIPDLQFIRWRKLVWNIPFNGLSVILNTTTDQLVGNPETAQLSKEIMREVIAGANACGIHLPEAFADEMLAYTQRMRPYSPSMKLDFEQGRPLEIRYIYENPVSAAQAAGYSMSRVDTLAQQLTFLERQRNSQAEM
ncbi:2-dehydropantoate 2-reductase [Siphonobacter sp. SORGH_AS_0500]|uniref:putative 2-dehydropantoate 2-reductase n=1 Tax=Siphonobacter sp. SORGH_AS_0500 TaxID=1864824 RepID=UPI000CC5DABC|nr:putative 2-dehydropantoate 2-reductase [Siphonobacter sp. SORGH_AS_0500]PKK37286.1 2-dehydropantoate 2-reductase [Siphonobacter sp. SORGH_AS_0500]